MVWTSMLFKKNLEAHCKALSALEELCAKCLLLNGKKMRGSGFYELIRSEQKSEERFAFIQYDRICAIYVPSFQPGGEMEVLRNFWQQLGPEERVIVFCESDYHSLIKSIVGLTKPPSYIVRAWL